MKDKDIQAAFKVIQLIYFALGFGMLITVGTFYLLVSMGAAGGDTSMADVFKIVVPIVGVSAFAMGKYLYKMQAAKSKSSDEQTKLTYYRTAALIEWALLEGAGLFSGIAYFITGDTLFLAFFAMIFVGYIYSKPSIIKFRNDF